MTKLRLFLVSAGISMAATLSFLIWRGPVSRAPRANRVKQVTENVSITSQLQLEDVRWLGRFATVVDVRPDGEAPDQTPSAQFAEVFRKTPIHFYYIPVPHESIPEEAVQRLKTVLSEPTGETLLYCRTGRRA